LQSAKDIAEKTTGIGKAALVIGEERTGKFNLKKPGIEIVILVKFAINMVLNKVFQFIILFLFEILTMIIRKRINYPI